MKDKEYILRKPLVFFDVEINPNIFHVGFKNPVNGKVVQIETKLGTEEKLSAEDRRKLKQIMMKYTTVGFNSNKYDIPMVKAAIAGKTNIEMFKMSEQIVSKNIQPWISDKQFNLPFMRVTTIDLQEPAPGVMVSLKKYGARLHSKKIQDLPFDYDKYLTPEEHEANKLYNINDLDTTIDLYNYIKPEIDLRYIMSDKYKMDLMSKGGAQIAEAVMIAELRKKNVEIKKFKPPKDYIMKYSPPECLEFMSDNLNEFLNKIIAEDFKLSKGKVVLPKWMTDPILINGKFKVKCGIGGLHSQEKKLVSRADEDYIVKNCDVGSYYPNLMMAYGYYPKNIGKIFLVVFTEIYNNRMKHKKAGNTDESDSLKLVLNGLFGKLGSNYSKVFAPELMIHVTISGQLLLMMLIEWLMNEGIEVLSTNTDGIEYRVHRSREKEIEALIEDWSKLTKMPMEHGTYEMLAARDVNNYVAIYKNEPKAKGAYAKPDIRKDSVHQIVYKAIRDYLYTGKEIEETINECEDVREFLCCKNATGGAQWKGQVLGKVVRWYYSRENGEPIRKLKDNAKVATTDYAVPMMELPENNEIPEDLDKSYYIEIALEQLENLGVDYFDDSIPFDYGDL